MASYQTAHAERSAIDALPGLVVLDFGTDWCSICRSCAPQIEAALAEQPELGHLKIEDGPGRALGRSFRIKLWPTLVILRDGREVARVVRPADAQTVRTALASA
ncbi:MAG: thioredoxin family protein [Pseudomonadota bacterium]